MLNQRSAEQDGFDNLFGKGGLLLAGDGAGAEGAKVFNDLSGDAEDADAEDVWKGNVPQMFGKDGELLLGGEVGDGTEADNDDLNELMQALNAPSVMPEVCAVAELTDALHLKNFLSDADLAAVAEAAESAMSSAEFDGVDSAAAYDVRFSETHYLANLHRQGRFQSTYPTLCAKLINGMMDNAGSRCEADTELNVRCIEYHVRHGLASSRGGPSLLSGAAVR